VARRDLVDGVRLDVHLLPGVGQDVQGAGDRVADVMEPACRGPRDGGHVDGPPPAGLVDAVPDDGLVEPDHRRVAVRERPDDPGGVEAPGVQARHGSPVRLLTKSLPVASG
jgi:hypothetical protein